MVRDRQPKEAGKAKRGDGRIARFQRPTENLGSHVDAEHRLDGGFGSRFRRAGEGGAKVVLVRELGRTLQHPIAALRALHRAGKALPFGLRGRPLDPDDFVGGAPVEKNLPRQPYGEQLDDQVVVLPMETGLPAREGKRGCPPRNIHQERGQVGVV